MHGVYYAMALHYGNIYNGDSFEYIQEAVNIKDHFFFYCGNLIFPVSKEYMTLRTPGYPLFIASVYIFTINNWVIILLQNIVSVFNVLYARKIFFDLGYPLKYDKWFLLLIVFFPSQLVYANLMAPDILLQTCSLLYVRYTLKFLKDKNVVDTLYMSLALVIGLFIKPVLYPFVLIHLIFILVISVIQKKQIVRFALSAFLPLLCVLLYSYGNQLRTGKFHFSSIQSFNAIYYYQRYYTDKIDAEKGKEFINNERKQIAKLPDFKQRYDRANERGITLLKQNFVPYMIYHLGKSCLFFLETGRGELDEFTGKLTLGKIYAGKSKKFSTVLKEKNFGEVVLYLKNNTTAVFALFILLTNFIKLIGVFLFLRYAKIMSIMKWFITLYLLYFALLTGPITNAHYVMPVSLIIMCCALPGYFYYFQKKKLLVNLPNT